MTASSITAPSPGPMQHHGHRHHTAGSAQDDSSQDFGSLSDVLGAGGAGSGSTAAAPSAGLQNFASQLQSILLGAQPGAAAAAGNAAAAPASAADPASPLSGPISHLADRLQALLSQSLSGAGAAASSAAQPVAGLQSVLDNLQQTLQQSLAAYQTPTASTASTQLTA